MKFLFFIYTLLLLNLQAASMVPDKEIDEREKLLKQKISYQQNEIRLSLQKILEKGERLETLKKRPNRLEETSKCFKGAAHRFKKKAARRGQCCGLHGFFEDLCCCMTCDKD